MVGFPKIYLSPSASGGGGRGPQPPRLPVLKGTIGDYRRGKLIGAGGMGEVFRATDERGQAVILKFISMRGFVQELKIGVNRGDITLEEAKLEAITFILRFLNEYDLAGIIRHPNLAKVIDTNIRLAVPQVDGLKNIFRKNPRTGGYMTPIQMRQSVLNGFDLEKAASKDIFLVTEFVPEEPGSNQPAPTVTDFYRRQPLSAAVVKKLFMPVFEVLAMAHEKGVAHRDLKPDNLLVTMVDGQPLVKIIDFGIARETDKDRKTQLTRAGSFLGTPTYMPPYEYIGAAAQNPEVFKISDIYSMGVVVFELMTGREPLVGLSIPQMLSFKSDVANYDFKQIDWKAQPTLQKMLSPRWQDNFSSMREVMAAWESI